MEKYRYAAKAVHGALVAGLAAVGTALADGEGISDLEWVGVAAAAVLAFGVVFQTTNTPPGPVPEPDAHPNAPYTGGH